jgi:hypothetical protein
MKVDLLSERHLKSVFESFISLSDCLTVSSDECLEKQ